MLRRAATSSVIVPGSEVAGPRVHTIFARRLMAGAPSPVALWSVSVCRLRTGVSWCSRRRGWMLGRMTWTAPQITRQSTPSVAGERQMLESWLDFHRQTLLSKCSGLTAEQLRQRSAPPSTMSLLGLVRHMTDVERGWFRRRIAGEDIAFLYASEADPDGEFDNVGGADAEQDFAVYLAEVELARQAAAGRGLDETFYHTRHKADMSVRWVYLHMIEEYARHNGHADLLRERIDGTTGD